MSKRNNFWGFDVANLDRKVRPQDDFFQFANGGWLKKNSIPHDESRWGSFDELRVSSIEALHGILKEVAKKKAKKGSELQKLRDLYLSGMDTKKLNKDGTKPLEPFFEIIDGAKDNNEITGIAGYLRSSGVSALWTFGADQDLKDRKIMRLYIEQGGLGLPDRDYYLKTDKKSIEIRRRYTQYISKIMSLALGKKFETKNEALAIIKIETRLARASMTRVERRDWDKQYNKMRLQGLLRLAPNIRWKEYFKTMNARQDIEFIVAQPKFIREVGKMFKDIPLSDWKTYLKWHVINSFSSYLDDRMRKEFFLFYRKYLSGMKKDKPRWRMVAYEIDFALGEALGKLYVEKYFKPKAKKEINILVDNLITAYRDRIQNLDWMGETTKKRALEKLRSFIRKLGYPDRWKSYRKLKISRDSYLENHVRASRFEFAKNIKKIGKRPDKKEWGMTPPTVNAYHNPLFCEIVFPAGIMQPPFFHPDADDAVNYGAIGAVIGHELTHGFDDQGRKFDKIGEMKNWWSERDRKFFEKKAQGLIEQYNKFEVLPGLAINGKLTLGENIADLGGLIMAYYAYKKSTVGKPRKVIGGFTPEQRFFLGAARAECGIAREAFLRIQINTDPHSPSKARVNLPLSNMTEFYEAFGVKKGDKMWRPEKDRVEIW